jgi:putative transposase
MNNLINNKDSKKPKGLSELSEIQRNDALVKYRLIEPFLKKEITLKRLCEQNEISLKTVSTWITQYRKLGLIGLSKKSRLDKGTRRSCTTEIKHFIEGLHLKKPHLSYASLYRQVREYTQKNNKPFPCYRTLCSIINRLPKPLTVLAQEGSKSYKQQFDLLYIREANYPNQIWQADHAVLDILILQEGCNEGVRPWLTIIFDDYSRAIAGYELSFSAPSAMKTSLALRQAIWRKKEFHWSICGIPSIFYTDHGSDFTSKHIEQVCIDLKIQMIFSNIGEPRGRGKIERFFLTLNQMLLSELEGYTGSKNVTPKLTLAELDGLIRIFIMNYNQRIHSTTEQAPKLRWEEKGFLPRMPESLERLDLLLLTVLKTRKIRRDGIHFQGLRYLDPVLADYVGVSVIIRYDPSDITTIRVFHRDEYLCQPICHDLDQEAVSLKEIQLARTVRRQTLQAEINSRLSLVDAILQSKPTKNRITPPTLKVAQKPQPKLKLYSHDD